MKGRKIGDSGGISLANIAKIIELTHQGKDRITIVRTLGISKATVWKYQTKFGLILNETKPVA